MVVIMRNPDRNALNKKANILRYVVILTPGIVILLGLGFLSSRRIEVTLWFCSDCGECVRAERRYFSWQGISPVREYKVIEYKKTILSDVLHDGSTCDHDNSFVCDFSPHRAGTTYRSLLIIDGVERNMLGQRTLFFTGLDYGYYNDCPDILVSRERATPRGKILSQLLIERKRSDPNYIATLKTSFMEKANDNNPLWKTLMQDLETSMTQVGF